MHTCHNSVRRGTPSVISARRCAVCARVWNGRDADVRSGRRPSDVVWPYTNGDVVVDDNGVGFRYSFSALKDRRTAVEVNYTDPQNGWQTSTELVDDPAAILRQRAQPAERWMRSVAPVAVRPTVPELWVIKTGPAGNLRAGGFRSLGHGGCRPHARRH